MYVYTHMLAITISEIRGRGFEGKEGGIYDKV